MSQADAESPSTERNQRKPRAGRVKKRTKRTFVAPPPIPEPMQFRHVLFGWKINIDEFLEKHSDSRPQCDQDVIANDVDARVVRLCAKACPGIGAFAFKDIIWLSRNYSGGLDAGMFKEGILPVPNQEGLKKLQEVLRLDRPPEWHSVDP
ncbi:hypothetical protein PENSPDRAFT_681794 [Peniophora sp. CONT]|nr:hypothetical protein PENSPDRAFT_681794 [Peniophora sp. CONT]